MSVTVSARTSACAITVAHAAPAKRLPAAAETSIRGNAAVTAAIPVVPIPWPMKIWSIVLYRPFTSIMAMVGRENFIRRRPTGA